MYAGDISPRQLELHAERTAEVEAAVEARELLDIVDLGRFDDECFDATVCYGSPLSYVLENAGTALGELLRVTKPGGHVLVSVMSLLGAARAFFSTLPQLIEEFGWERAVDEIFEKRDLAADVNKGHVCRLYRWSDLQRLVEPLPCRIVAASASNFLSVQNESCDDRFLQHEVAACQQPES